MSTETRLCQSCKKDFTIEPEDFVFYEKLQVPLPTFCPECRLVRRLAWRNERTLHKRKCDKCGKAMISIFSPASGLTVYCSACWWSDSWDALDYGVDYDSHRPFLVQLKELFSRVPQMNLYLLYTTVVNSEYANMAGYLKDCYLVTYADYSEKCMYSNMINNSKDSVDNLLLDKSELCYGSINCRSCYKAFYCLDSDNCRNTWWCRNCTDCADCFGSVNLKGKQYHIFNEAYSKEDYEEKLRGFQMHSYGLREEMRGKAYALWRKFPQKYAHERFNVNVSGEYVYHSKNTFNSYVVQEMEDCKFCAFTSPGKTANVYDFLNWGTNLELAYDSIQCGMSSRIRFSWWANSNCENVEYSMFPTSSHNVFGTVGLKKKDYCILNKQYDKETYYKLRQKIIQDMNDRPYITGEGHTYRYGEFFPTELSPFGYNETTAQEFFPLTKETSEEKKYVWRENAVGSYKPTLLSKNIPNTIQEVGDDVLGAVVQCASQENSIYNCPGVFRILPQELEFYRNLNIPLPHHCPNCRLGERLRFRNGLRLTKRECQCGGKKSADGIYENTRSHHHGVSACPNSFLTAFARDNPDIIYCEVCYQSEIL